MFHFRDCGIVHRVMEHEVSVSDRGGCCDDHPYSGYVAFCYDCNDSVGSSSDWSDAQAQAEEHQEEQNKIEEEVHNTAWPN